MTSLKTLKKSKKFLKEYNWDIVLYDFDYFVGFSEMANIYTFQSIIEDNLESLNGFPIYIINMFY